MAADDFTGPPPSEGWWPTGDNEYRFWNGLFWSIPADKEFDETQAGVLGMLPCLVPDIEITWRHWREGETDEMPNADLF